MADLEALRKLGNTISTEAQRFVDAVRVLELGGITVNGTLVSFTEDQMSDLLDGTKDTLEKVLDATTDAQTKINEEP